MIWRLPWLTYKQAYEQELLRIDREEEAFKRGLERGHKQMRENEIRWNELLTRTR